MKRGSMWWWILPLATDVLKRLIVGHERKFPTWFYEGATAKPASIEPAAIDEYLRSSSGVEGVLGAHGVYRTAFTTMGQTAPLTMNKVRVPVIALGGDKSLGDKVQQMVATVAGSVEGHTIANWGHFMPAAFAASDIFAAFGDPNKEFEQVETICGEQASSHSETEYLAFRIDQSLGASIYVAGDLGLLSTSNRNHKFEVSYARCKEPDRRW